MKRVTFWLAYPSTPKGGISRVLDEIDALGIDACLSVRIGQSGRLENGVDEKFVQLCQERLGAARVEIWWGSSPRSIDAEVNLAKKFFDIGVQRFVVNAETAWKARGSNELATQYVAKLRAALPNAFVAHAPFAMWMSHGNGEEPFPYVGFGSLDCAFNQLYPNEFGGSRDYWNKRYEREVNEFKKLHPGVATQSVVAMGDIYGADFGSSWGLTPATVRWADEHLNAGLAVGERMGDAEIAFYSIDAALSETERSASKPWLAVKKWAQALKNEHDKELAEETAGHTDEEGQQTLLPRIAKACWGRFGGHTE